MPTPSQRAVQSRRGVKAASFNYNKLQAVACMAASAAVSIALIYWAIKSLF